MKSNIFSKPIEEIVKNKPQTMIEIINNSSFEDVLFLLSSCKNTASVSKIIDLLSNEQILRIIESKDKCYSILIKNISDKRLVHLLVGLNEKLQNTIIPLLPEDKKEAIVDLISYPEDSIGYLISREHIQVNKTASKKDILRAIKKEPGKTASLIFITSIDGEYEGYIPVEFLLKKSFDTVSEILKSDVKPVNASTPISEFNYKEYRGIISSLPVIDNDGRLIGTISEHIILNVIKDDSLSTIQTMVGVSKDEKSTSGALDAVKKRFSWLAINLVTVIIAGSIINTFEDIISQMTALAVLLPIISGQAGNTGAQAQAVTMRGLAVKEIGLKHWKFLCKKELFAGLINGTVIGALAGIGTFIWSSSTLLAITVFLAMSFTLAVSGLFGTFVPLALKFFKKDPAISSSIILTTLTDCAGFATLLILADIIIIKH